MLGEQYGMPTKTLGPRAAQLIIERDTLTRLSG